MSRPAAASWTGHTGRSTRCPSAPKGGPADRPEPHRVDEGRDKRDSKYHLLVDRAGTALNVAVSGANRHDSIFLEPVLDSIPAIKIGGRVIRGAVR